MNQFALADDLPTTDAIYKTASERIVELEKGLVSFERRKATARGRREPTSVLDILKNIWRFPGGLGGGRCFPSDIYDLIF